MNTPTFQAPPIRTPFVDANSTDGSGINQPWIKWFNAIQQELSLVQQVSATQDSLPTDFTSVDSGLLVAISDYGHLLEWSGSAFVWAVGEAGSGYVALFVNPPTQKGWHLCDGSTVKQLQQDGSLIDVVLPTIANTYFRQ